MNVFTPAAWPDSQELEREQGLELVAGCLAERLSADNVLISVPGDEGRPSAVRAGAGLGGSLWDEEQLVRRVLQSEDTLVERFLERKGPGDLACVVAAPIRMPHGVAGAACAGFRTPPPLSSSTLSWLVESHAALAALCLEEPAVFRRLLAAALVDGLTGCLNYSRLRQALDEEINRCRRHERQLSCCFIDLDGFKRVNQVYGHAGGNRILRVVGRALSQGVRSCDLVGRYGGDEFVVVLPEVDAEHAARLGQRLRARIESETADLVGERISASIGVSQWQPTWTAEELLRCADDALDRAKETGQKVTLSQSAGRFARDEPEHAG